eukprot:129861_1
MNHRQDANVQIIRSIDLLSKLDDNEFQSFLLKYHLHTPRGRELYQNMLFNARLKEEESSKLIKTIEQIYHERPPSVDLAPAAPSITDLPLAIVATCSQFLTEWDCEALTLTNRRMFCISNQNHLHSNFFQQEFEPLKTDLPSIQIYH